MKLYLKGYEEGQKEAWSNIKNLVSRFEGWELKTRVESKIGTLYQEVQSKRVELEDNPSELIIEGEESSIKEDEGKSTFELNLGNSYLMLGRDKESFNTFQSVLDEENPGLIISRESPEKMMKKYDLNGNIKFVWLTTSTSRKVDVQSITWKKVSPGSLSKISTEIGKFLKNNENGVILLSGLPNLINYNEFNKVLDFVSWTIDQTYQKQGYFIVSLSPSTLKEKEIGKISDEFDVVERFD